MAKLHIRQTVDLYFEILEDTDEPQQAIIEAVKKRAEEVITNAACSDIYDGDLAVLLESSAVESFINPDRCTALEILTERTCTDNEDWTEVNGPEAGVEGVYYFERDSGGVWCVDMDRGEAVKV